MASVYIIYSKSINSYYIGFTTESVALRLERHNTDYYDNKYTGKGKPWELFLEIVCQDKKQASTIEKYIKAMKSKKYIQNLKAYPEMVQKLLDRFQCS